MLTDEIKLTPRESWLAENIKGKYIINIGFVGKGKRGSVMHEVIKERKISPFIFCRNI